MTHAAHPAGRRGWRRLLHFRLSTLLIATTVASILMGWFGVRWYRALRESWSIEAIRNAGGNVVTREDGSARRVWLGGERINDGRLRELIPLLLDLSTLEELDLVETPITDESLSQIARLRQLKLLYVHETEATDDGLAQLQRSLPSVDLRREAPDPIAAKIAMRPIFRHAVIAAAFSPSDAQFVTGSGDGTLRWWRIGQNEPDETVQAHGEWLFAAAFEPDGQRVATGGGDNLIRLWDAETHQLLSEWAGHDDDVHALVFDPSGQYLYSAGDDAVVRVWNVAEGRQAAVLDDHQAQISGLAISPDGRLLASASRDETVRVWDVGGSKLKVRFVLKGHAADVAAVAFSPDGRTLASAGYDRKIRVWDMASGEQRCVLAGHQDWVFALGFYPDGNRLVSGGGDATVRTWNLETQQEVTEYRGQKNIAAIAIARDGRTLATTSAEGTVVFRDVANDTVIAVLRTRFGDRSLAMRNGSVPEF
jgi:WD40 repeat protein